MDSFGIEVFRRRYDLPEGLSWFEVNGQFVFPTYGPMGDVCNTVMLYIVERVGAHSCNLGLGGLMDNNDTRVYGIRIVGHANEEAFRAAADDAVRALLERKDG